MRLPLQIFSLSSQTLHIRIAVFTFLFPSLFEISSHFCLILQHASDSSMAISSRGGTEVLVPKRWRERETSPERTKVWSEPKPKTERKVPVVYYLCRNGRLEHPHFMEVSLSSNEGLYLRDVINRLNFLRGKGMSSMYSWSSKRSYKNGFVWHDLSENDFIYPAYGQEYVLKGSELLEAGSSSGSQEAVSSSSEKSLEMPKSGDDPEFPVTRRRNLSWSVVDTNECKIYKADSTVKIAGKAADASTQTDDKRRRQRAVREDKEEQKGEEKGETNENSTTEQSVEEISPLPSSSSPETLESLLMKVDRGAVSRTIGAEEREISDVGNRTGNNHQSGKIRASTVLMQLISCGSVSVRDDGLSLVSHYRGRLPRGGRNQDTENASFGGVKLEDKEYFSGSLIEMKKGSKGAGEFQGLKRSSSCNADRSSKSDLMAKEIEGGARAKCKQRKPKPPVKKESSAVSRSDHGSKRIDNVKL